MSIHSPLTASGVMLLAGIGIPLMAALNSGLGTRLNNPVQAATVLFAVGLVCCLSVLWLTSAPMQWGLKQIPMRYFLGGVLVAFYILAMTFVGPIVGVGRAIILVLVGQIISSAVIDHFGLLGTPQTSITWMRLAGVLVLSCGVALTRLGHAP